MEMYSKGLADNAAMLRGSNIPIEPPSLKENPDVNQSRKLLFALIGIDLILFLINFLFIIHSYAASESLESQSPNSSSQLFLIIVSLIYYGFGLLVTHRYYQTGLLFFTLLGVVVFVLTDVTVVMLLIRIIHTANHVGFVAAGLIVAIIFVAICAITSALQIFIIIYAFKLHRLLEKNKRLTIEQI
ncbi:unnamed protein product [Rotaria magnacalcarata]|uniref:Uncharacterized protein n=1 Tax=Rotaria magnacalcarata TaxID=392030 RepID=A0A815J2H7_9BILA|nr:unnamed protein product [Rotaria magnacalcarata]CAF1371156.1 unnamed protein product [Rotaria magnacalcarata]CAF2049012.1 unnamed protein product [Rotaria magnacalcarata]CAF2055286.1 unnamed protein product [Rotaria magnacalcarata]CAF2077270.1 unnamed protein product [Rotaria magnacalcarata]